MKFTLNRDKVVMTKTGHAIGFKKGEPTHVPHGAYAEVLAVGAVAAEDIEEEPIPESKEPTDPAKREKLILATMDKMAEANKRDDFTGTGMPTLPALSDRLGFKIDTKERDALWTKRVQGQG